MELHSPLANFPGFFLGIEMSSFSLGGTNQEAQGNNRIAFILSNGHSFIDYTISFLHYYKQRRLVVVGGGFGEVAAQTELGTLLRLRGVV